MSHPHLRPGLTVLVVLAALVTLGCANHAEYAVKMPLADKPKAATFTLVAEKPAAPAIEGLDDVSAAMDRSLDEKVFRDGKFSKGSDMTIRYTIAEFDPGSKAARMLAGGFGAGKAHTTTNFVIMNGSNHKIGEVDVTSTIGSSAAFSKTANQISDDTAEAFVKYLRSTFN
jgi:hypothetical protein